MPKPLPINSKKPAPKSRSNDLKSKSVYGSVCLGKPNEHPKTGKKDRSPQACMLEAAGLFLHLRFRLHEHNVLSQGFSFIHKAITCTDALAYVMNIERADADSYSNT